ncbi:Uma2 family endonuclease [Rhodococcus sp. D2-41]|uniref:Uma2 family endonuclease n=1 Tax=Speluncibacter jeojiensis TaxID=2710754 RepID=A0A9X4LZ76_9ACTN|nr:Uma2 family endonuclease [Rhodococcus sp. D2-41]MDG3011570.1 Uma2 family endonuclease [Rhodococcus sp. D2-41]MDG3015073.1 Uma2 family endonuclease [Corynebacteriales bacterium D3-21]
MASPTVPDHLVTLDEWNSRPRYERFVVEVVAGVPVIEPRPMLLHQRVANRLVTALDRQLPDELSAVGHIELLLESSPLTVRCPDVLVVGSALVAANRRRARATDVSLVVEVVSECTRRTDRVTKFAEYARAGIGRYWIVDIAGTPRLSAFESSGAGYVPVGELVGDGRLIVAGREVALDVAALTARRPR